MNNLGPARFIDVRGHGRRLCMVGIGGSSDPTSLDPRKGCQRAERAANNQIQSGGSGFEIH